MTEQKSTPPATVGDGGLGWNILGGLTVFCAMVYIAIANPLILANAHVPAHSAFIATCLIAGIGSVLVGVIARSPTAIAPGLAFNFFLVDFLNKNQLDWGAGLLACAIVGALLVVVSAKGWRLKLVKAIPTPLLAAITGGIGSILAGAGLKFAQGDSCVVAVGQSVGQCEFSRAEIWVLLVGLGIIVTLQVFGKWLKGKADIERSKAVLGELFYRGSILASVLVAWAMCAALGVKPELTLETGGENPFQAVAQTAQIVGSSWAEVGEKAYVGLIFFFGYLLIIDIAGSPWLMLRKERETKAETDEREKRTTSAFVVESCCNVVGPFLGTSPAVFYAENAAARVVQARGRTVAIVVGVLFIALLIGFELFRALFHIQTFELVPGQVIAPGLIAVGVMIIAEALGVDEGKEVGDSPGAVVSDLRMPAAIAIVLTPVVGLEWSIAAAFAAYYLYIFIDPAPEARAHRPPNEFHVIAVLAVLAFVFFFWGAWR